jgi:hypothetical protein
MLNDESQVACKYRSDSEPIHSSPFVHSSLFTLQPLFFFVAYHHPFLESILPKSINWHHHISPYCYIVAIKKKDGIFWVDNVLVEPGLCWFDLLVFGFKNFDLKKLSKIIRWCKEAQLAILFYPWYCCVLLSINLHPLSVMDFMLLFNCSF